MSRRRIITCAVASLALVATVTGCSYTPTAQDKENAQQQAASNNLVASQPVPAPPYSVMRQELGEIRLAEATGSPTTQFEFIMGMPNPIRTCSAVGMPIPANASISNPHQVVQASINGTWSNEVLDQMEPNGTYPSASTAGTYMTCVDAQGRGRPDYAEGIVHAVPGAAHWDEATHQIVATGDPSFHFSTKCVMNGNVPVCS